MGAAASFPASAVPLVDAELAALQEQGASDAEACQRIRTLLERTLGPGPTAAEREAAADRLEQVLLQLEADRAAGGGAQAAGAQADNYEASFSGTKKDTQVEAEFGALLRGEEDAAPQQDRPLTLDDIIVLPCTCTPLPGEAHSDACEGVWSKHLNADSSCFFFLRSVTNEVVWSRPHDYVDPGGEEEEEEVEAVPRCPLTELPARLDEIIGRGKTPLILDCSAEHKVASFFQYKGGKFIEGRLMALGWAKTGVKKADILEASRAAMVAALRTGTTLVVNLEGFAVDFKQTWCHFKSFPLQVFEAGKMAAPARHKKYFTEEEKDQGQCIVRDGFRVVVVSSLGPAEYEAQLAANLPLQHLEAVHCV